MGVKEFHFIESKFVTVKTRRYASGVMFHRGMIVCIIHLLEYRMRRGVVIGMLHFQR